MLFLTDVAIGMSNINENLKRCGNDLKQNFGLHFLRFRSPPQHSKSQFSFVIQSNLSANSSFKTFTKGVNVKR